MKLWNSANSTKPDNISTGHNLHLCLNIKYNYFDDNIG